MLTIDSRKSLAVWTKSHEDEFLRVGESRSDRLGGCHFPELEGLPRGCDQPPIRAHRHGMKVWYLDLCSDGQSAAHLPQPGNSLPASRQDEAAVRAKGDTLNVAQVGK